MPTPTKKMHSMTGTPNGDVIDLGDEYNSVQITARGPVRVRAQLRTPGTAAPSNPGADPLASNGDEASGDWTTLAADDVTTYGPDATGRLRIRYVETWELSGAAGLILQCEAK